MMSNLKQHEVVFDLCLSVLCFNTAVLLESLYFKTLTLMISLGPG